MLESSRCYSLPALEQWLQPPGGGSGRPPRTANVEYPCSEADNRTLLPAGVVCGSDPDAVRSELNELQALVQGNGLHG